MFPSKKRHRDEDFHRDPFDIGLDDGDSFFQLHYGPIPHTPPLFPAALPAPAPAPQRRPPRLLTMWRAGLCTPSVHWHRTLGALRKSRDRLAELERGGPPAEPSDHKPRKRSLQAQVKMQRQHVNDWQLRMFLAPPDPLAAAPSVGKRAAHILDRLAQESRMRFRAQHKIAWDSERGFCVSLAMEFLHWRNSGMPAAHILPRLGRLDARLRLREVQSVSQADAYACNSKRSAWRKAQAAGTDAAATAAAKCRYLNTKTHAWTASAGAMYRSLLTDHGGGIDWKEWPFDLGLCKGFHPEFSLESFYRYAPAAYRNEMGFLLEGLVGIDPSGLPVPQRQTEALEGSERGEHALRLQESWQAWVETARHLHVGKRSVHALPFYTINFDTRRVELDPHMIALDLSPERPGFFDANFGFLPLDRHTPLNDRFAWILALLILYYSADRVDIFNMHPRLQLAADRTLPKLDNIMKLRFLRGGIANPARVFARLPIQPLPFSSRGVLPDPFTWEK